MANLAYGTLTITNLSIVTSVDIYYYNSTSPTSLSGDEWSTDTPTWTDGKYVWSKTVTTWEQGVTTQSEPVCITGQKGSTGATGQSVVRITQQYALGSNSTTAPTTGWDTAMPPFETGKYYWTRSEIVWANPTSTTYTTAVLANGITSANTTAATANSNASAAVATANSADTKADSANQTAQNAVSIANGKSTIYYSSSKPTGGTYKAGDTWFFLTDDGYKLFEYDTNSSDWVQKPMDGKAITAGTITAAQIHSGAITTDKIYSNAITANKLATDAIKSSNYVAGTAPYSGAGTFLDLTNGNIYSPNFGVNNDSTDNITDGAYIKGSIYAYNGTIGSNIETTQDNPNPNYWYIGDYWDYNQNLSAYIKGNGTATIQLGNLSTWRLNTNRIHTAWNDDSQQGDFGKLHYPIYDSKYWDMGLHVPSSTTDKFIYIRKSKVNYDSSNILTNLQNSIDDQVDGTNNNWNYQFYVTSEGNLYAKNIYVLDQYNNPIQIGGSGGIAGVLQVYSGGTGSTSFTSKGIIYASNTNPQTLLSTAAGTSGQLLSSGGSQGAPSWINASSLSVSHAATATKATQDGSGNVITSTYVPLSGGTITGSLTVQNGIAGDLTGKVNGFTLGMNVPNGSKLTDTVTTVTTTGDGNAITSISATNGAITATKGSTFLTSYTQTDPIFSASVAAGIQQTDIDNWNSKTNNVGTVTSVKVQASAPLQSSVNTAQSGTLDTTISFTDQDVNKVLAGPSSGTAAAAPTFRKLVAADIPNLAWSKITSGNDDLKAIEALTGTTGLLKKTAANKWALDTTAYVPTSRTVNGHALSSNVSVTKADVGLGNVENALQIIDIGSNDAGQLVLTFGDNSTDTRTVSITATTSSSVAKAEALNTNGAKVGDSNQPVYFGTDGKPTAISYTIEKSVPADAIFSYTFDGTYNASTNKAATVSTVTSAINALDGGTIGTGGTGKTITALSQTNGQVSATFSNISITKSQVSDFSHSHGNILNAGTITSTAVALGNGDSLLFADSSNSGKIEKSSITIGTGTTKYLREDGTWGTPGGTYSLPLAANGTRGGVQIGYSSSGKNYAVQLSNEKMYVNVPWTDTTYDAATANPLMDGTVAVGTSTKYARQDHKHPSDTSRVPTTRKINNHALNADITISKSDIGLGNVENTALSTALQGYVTLDTTQSISGRKTFNDLASTVFKGSTGNEYCNINYDQTLSALVFNFG